MSTIERLAELAKECYRKSWRHLAESRFEDGCTPDVIIKAEAEYKALEAENERLRQAAKLAESALTFIFYNGQSVDPAGAINALRAALAQGEVRNAALIADVRRQMLDELFDTHSVWKAIPEGRHVSADHVALVLDAAVKLIRARLEEG